MQFLDLGVEQLKHNASLLSIDPGSLHLLELAREKMEELVSVLRNGCIPPKFKRINLSEIIWEQISLLESIAQDRKIELKMQLSSEDIIVNADPNQLGRCLMNVIKNAVEACSENDSVTISTIPFSELVVITINDTGCGMDADTLASIWTPLFSTKPEGNGLGAFIARTVILKHHGLIEAESKPGIGTTIRIQLPRKSDIDS